MGPERNAPENMEDAESELEFCRLQWGRSGMPPENETAEVPGKKDKWRFNGAGAECSGKLTLNAAMV